MKRCHLARLGVGDTEVFVVARTSEGFLHGDLACMRLGQGPRLEMVQGLWPRHDNPQGGQRRSA